MTDPIPLGEGTAADSWSNAYVNHVCHLPIAPRLDLQGAVWRCKDCGAVFIAKRVWATMDEVYTRCNWYRCNWLRRWWLTLTRPELKH